MQLMAMAIESVSRKDRKLKRERERGTDRERERETEIQRGKVQRLAKALDKVMYASGLGSAAQAERTEVTLQEESLSRTWFWVILFAMAAVLFGVFLIWNQYKNLEKRMEENELALRPQILGLSSAKDESEEARLEFKSYMRDDANAFTEP